jgi:hypothetical protein
MRADVARACEYRIWKIPQLTFHHQRYRNGLRKEVVHNGTQSFINHRLYRHVSDALKAPVDDELRYELYHQRVSQYFSDH